MSALRALAGRRSSAVRASWASKPTSAFSRSCCSVCNAASDPAAAAIDASSAWHLVRRRASSTSRSAAVRSLSSLISRRVAEDAARLDARAARHQMRAAQHVALERRHRRVADARKRHRLLERLGDVGDSASTRAASAA